MIAWHISNVGWVQRSETQHPPGISGLLGFAIAPPNLQDIQAFRRCVSQSLPIL
jgi:hypothetical protein